MTLRGTRLALSASLLTLAAAMGTPAYAQDAAQDQAADEAPLSDKEIIVTGSLIARPNNTAVSPIVSVGETALKETGQVNLQDALNQFPSFTTAGNANTGGQGTEATAAVRHQRQRRYQHPA